MVKGLDTFRRYFEEYENQYVLIGGVACDIVYLTDKVLTDMPTAKAIL